MKGLIAAGIMGAVGASFIAGANIYMVQRYGNKILPIEELKDQRVDCIMVLGAKVKLDGQPCTLLEKRIDTGVLAYNAGISDRILMTGDHGQKEYDEVNAMKDFAADLGVPRDDIFLDHAGFSTYESMYRAKEVFGIKKMVIVTQKYHLYRAVYIANKLGIDAYGICAEDLEDSTRPKREIREVAARIKDIGYVMFEPKPTYLGDSIPISGSAAKTDDK